MLAFFLKLIKSKTGLVRLTNFRCRELKSVLRITVSVPEQPEIIFISFQTKFDFVNFILLFFFQVVSCFLSALGAFCLCVYTRMLTINIPIPPPNHKHPYPSPECIFLDYFMYSLHAVLSMLLFLYSILRCRRKKAAYLCNYLV